MSKPKKEWKQGADLFIDRQSSGSFNKYTLELHMTHGQLLCLRNSLDYYIKGCEAVGVGNAVAEDLKSFINNAMIRAGEAE
jgi:hypothetical protein